MGILSREFKTGTILDVSRYRSGLISKVIPFDGRIFVTIFGFIQLHPVGIGITDHRFLHDDRRKISLAPNIVLLCGAVTEESVQVMAKMGHEYCSCRAVYSVRR